MHPNAMHPDVLLIDRARRLFAPLSPRPTGRQPKLQPLAGIKAVLFDIYGTLLISASGDIGLVAGTTTPITLAQLFDRAALDPAPVALADTDTRPLISAVIKAHHRQAREHGIGVPEVDILAIWAQVLADLGLDIPPEQRRRIALEYEALTNQVWPMPGLAETLEALRQAGLVMGIVSNAQFYTPLLLEAFLGDSPSALGLEPECSAWSYRLGIAKPSTAIYEPALEGLRRAHRIKPDEVLYIGNDLRNDIWPAGELGMRTALFAGDARSLRLREDDPSLSDVAPDRVVTELRQVISLCPAPEGW